MVEISRDLMARSIAKQLARDIDDHDVGAPGYVCADPIGRTFSPACWQCLSRIVEYSGGMNVWLLGNTEKVVLFGVDRDDYIALARRHLSAMLAAA